MTHPSTCEPTVIELVSAFIRKLRENAGKFQMLSKTIAGEPRLRAVLTEAFREQLELDGIAASPIALTQVAAKTLSMTCDELYRPSDLYENPEALLLAPYPGNYPPDDAHAQLWMAVRLHWIAGLTHEKTCERMHLSVSKLRRLLDEAAPAIDAYWLARYTPNLLKDTLLLIAAD